MTIPGELEQNQDSDVILAHMRADPALSNIDTSSGTPVNMVLAPVAIEIANGYVALEHTLWRSRVVGAQGETAQGDDLLAITNASGIDRLPGQKATGYVRFTGPLSTNIPANTIATTLGPNQLRFTTLSAATIPVGGNIDVPAEAVAVGSDYNVPGGAIQLLETQILQTSVTNLTPFTGGVNIETDAELTARYLDFMRDPPNGSNPAQYRAWAREVPGVGAAAVLRPGEPNGPTPGVVDLYIVDNLRLPASQVLIDAVQDYIAPPRKVTLQAEAAGFTSFNANGISTVDLATDVGTTIRMSYHASGPGERRHAAMQALLGQAGEWDIRPRWLVNNSTGVNNMVTVEVYSTTNAQIARTTAAAAFGTATYTRRANQLLTTFSEEALPFYWDGVEVLELRVRRLATDAVTVLDIDSFLLRSHFSSNALEGLAPILDEVRVKAAVPVSVAVTAAVKVLPGYAFSGAGGVQVAVQAAITSHLQGLAFVPDDQGGNDVIYGEIGAVIQTTQGVDYYDPATFRVNGSTLNVTVGKHQIATPGVYTITELP